MPHPPTHARHMIHVMVVTFKRKLTPTPTLHSATQTLGESPRAVVVLNSECRGVRKGVPSIVWAGGVDNGSCNCADRWELQQCCVETHLSVRAIALYHFRLVANVKPSSVSSSAGNNVINSKKNTEVHNTHPLYVNMI